jgi:hypothetical protein
MNTPEASLVVPCHKEERILWPMLSAIHATMHLLNLNECNRESLIFALTEVPYMKSRAIHYEIAESVTYL